MRKIDRGIVQYYLYKSTATPGFMWPIYTIFLLDQGLSFTQIGMTGAATALTTILMEIPSGYVGDKLGRKNSLAISKFLFAVVPTGLILASGFPQFLIVFSLLGMADAFMSGSDDAWLYDFLRQHDSTDRFTFVRGRGGAIRRWVGAAAMLGGGLLYTINPEYPFVATAIHSSIGVVFLLTMPKASGDSTRESEAVLNVVKKQLTTPRLRIFVLYIGLLHATVRAVEEFVQPVITEATDSSGLLVSQLSSNLPEAVFLGLVYATFSFISATASDYASNVSELFGLRNSLLFVPLLTGFGMLLPVLFPASIIYVIFAIQGVKSVMRPLTNQYLNDQIESVGRATTLSAASFIYSIITIPLMVVGGMAADQWGVNASVISLGVIIFTIMSFLALKNPVSPSKSVEGSAVN